MTKAVHKKNTEKLLEHFHELSPFFIIFIITYPEKKRKVSLLQSPQLAEPIWCKNWLKKR